jgi:hypothetical protein
MVLEASHLHATHFGKRLPDAGTVALWTCESAYKVSRSRPLPVATTASLNLEGARGEEEAVQLVLRPEEAVHGLTASVDDLIGPGGARIPAEQVEVWRVGYVPIHTPTDAAGEVGEWPDPLPPLNRPINLAPNRNQPLWITVRIPTGIPAGEYHCTVRLRAEGIPPHEVPLRLTVWDVTLPERPHIVSAFGFNPELLRAYHHLTSEGELAEVEELYYRNFARHRISPYQYGAGLVPIRVEEQNGQVHVDFVEFDRVARYHLDELGFTTFQLPTQGLGSGTFFERQPGHFLGHQEGTPEYERLFGEYLRQLQDHLEQQDWLERAYFYWFDEPEAKDYDFVRAGMQRIHRHAPRLARMLTVQPEEALQGAVDIWCPMLPRYRTEAARHEQKSGRKVWWYVCTQPKAPYTTLFIDHPATSLRAWVWLTYQYGVDGVLVWATNYWTSATAFPPPALQNPYEDPMSYQQGYGTAPGAREHWGNGDGRFLYPPDGYVDGRKRLEGPVNSLRWEMLREGLEDADLFFALRDAVAEARGRGAAADRLTAAEALLEVPASVISAPNDFNPDPQPLLEHRRAVAQMIEALRR